KEEESFSEDAVVAREGQDQAVVAHAGLRDFGEIGRGREYIRRDGFGIDDDGVEAADLGAGDDASAVAGGESQAAAGYVADGRVDRSPDKDLGGNRLGAGEADVGGVAV